MDGSVAFRVINQNKRLRADGFAYTIIAVFGRTKKLRSEIGGPCPVIVFPYKRPILYAVKSQLKKKPTRPCISLGHVRDLHTIGS